MSRPACCVLVALSGVAAGMRQHPRWIPARKPGELNVILPAVRPSESELQLGRPGQSESAWFSVTAWKAIRLQYRLGDLKTLCRRRKLHALAANEDAPVRVLSPGDRPAVPAAMIRSCCDQATLWSQRRQILQIAHAWSRQNATGKGGCLRRGFELRPPRRKSPTASRLQQRLAVDRPASDPPRLYADHRRGWNAPHLGHRRNHAVTSPAFDYSLLNYDVAFREDLHKLSQRHRSDKRVTLRMKKRYMRRSP